nr:hypothetical protein [Propionibacterium sp.]
MAEQAVIAAVPPRTAPARASRVRIRRNIRWLTAGLLAMALGGLGTWALFAGATGTRPAIKVMRTVYRGQAIQANDLAVIALGRTTDVAAVAGGDLNRVVGQTAVTDLPAGSLLVERSFGAPELAAGLARVGLKVDAGRIPATALKPGARVLVVALPATGANPGTPPPSVEATLATTPTLGADGAYLVDVNVGLADAEQVARLGALKQVALVQKAEG